MTTSTKKELESIENEFIEAWHIGMSKRDITFKISLTQLGLCAERLCKASYIRKYKKAPFNSETFFKMTNTLYNDKELDYQTKHLFDTVRKPAATRRHDSIIIGKAFLDKMRLVVLDIVRWYIKKYRLKFENLKLSFYEKQLLGKPVYTQYRLNKKGVISEKRMYQTMENETLMAYRFEDKKLLRTPIYSSLLIDVSGSMQPYQHAVIEGHKKALETIRGSMVCRQNSLFLMQYLFNHKSTLINPLTLVNENQSDAIIALDHNNYKPHSTTALFDTLYEAINIICMEVDALKNTKGKKPEIILGLMTDGIDNESKNYTASDIKALMQELKNEGVIKNAVIIGWTNTLELNQRYLKNLTTEIGFNEYLSLDQNPSSIREGFNLWSQRAV